MRTGLMFLFCLLWLAPACTPTMDANQSLKDGQYDRAIMIYQELLDEDPSSIKNRISLGRAYYYTGRFKEAKEQFQAVLVEKDHQFDASFYLGLVEIAQDDRKAGFDTIRTAEADYFQPIMAKELRCSADYVQEQDLPTDKTLEIMELYYNEVRKRQDFRGGTGSNHKQGSLPLECPPRLGKVLYAN